MHVAASSARSSGGGIDRGPAAVLSTIGAGVGGLAFFTFVGGAITAARARGMGVSGTKTVGLIPKADLLAVGAQALVWPCVAGVAACAVFLLVGRDRQLRLVLLLLLAVIGLTVTGWATPYHPGWWWQEPDAFLLLVALISLGGYGVNRLAPTLPHYETESPAKWPKRAWNRLKGAARRRWRSRAPAAALLFLVVMLAGTIVQFGAERANPKVHVAAVLRGDRAPPVCGLYVTESGDVVLLVMLGSGERRYLAAVPRATVTAVAIGDSVKHMQVGRIARAARVKSEQAARVVMGKVLADLEEKLGALHRPCTG